MYAVQDRVCVQDLPTFYPLYGALPGEYEPVRLHAVLWSQRALILAAPQDLCIFRCQYLWNDLADLVFDCVGLAGFKSKANTFFIDRIVEFYRLSC